MSINLLVYYLTIRQLYNLNCHISKWNLRLIGYIFFKCKIIEGKSQINPLKYEDQNSSSLYKLEAPPFISTPLIDGGRSENLGNCSFSETEPLEEHNIDLRSSHRGLHVWLVKSIEIMILKSKPSIPSNNLWEKERIKMFYDLILS